MKSKFLLPVMAMIFAIGMSFANVERSNDPNNDYVHLGGGSWQTIAEQNCPPLGNQTCRVQFGVDGPIYEVYDQMDLSTRKNSTTREPNVINP